MQCIVSSCGEDLNNCDALAQCVTFFELPREPRLRQRWLQGLGMQGWHSTASSFVCSNHFLAEDLYVSGTGRQMLRAGAVPVLQTTLKSSDFFNVNPSFTSNRVVNTKIENIQTDIYAKFESVHVTNADTNKVDFFNEENITTDGISLNSIHNKYVSEDIMNVECKSNSIANDNIVKDGNENEQEDVIKDNVRNDVNGNVGNDFSGWFDVPLSSINADKGFLGIEIEKYLDNAVNVEVERDRVNCGQPISNNEIGNGVERSESLGEDNSADVHQLTEEGEEVLVNLDFTRADNVLIMPKNVQLLIYPLHEPQPSSPVTKSSFCNKCNGKVTGRRHIKCLVTICTGEKRFQCNVCNAAFKHRKALIVHLRIHTGQTPYSCNICNKTFQVKNKFKNHLKTHVGEKANTCEICDRLFLTSESFKHHIKSHESKKPHTCDVCKKVFPCRRLLEKHSVIHSNDRPFPCHLCKKTFNTSGYLYKHLKIHSGIKPYTCDVCDKSFSENHKLVSHARRHSGDKPFPCNVCEKRFVSKCALARHSNRHSVNKTYACDVCRKSFSERYDLRRHFKVHTGEKFVCNVCKKSFIDNFSLEKHTSQCSNKT